MESVRVYGAAYGDDLRLMSSSRRGAERGLAVAAAVHGFLGLPMRASKCWADRLRWCDDGEMTLDESQEEGLRYGGVERSTSGVLGVGCGIQMRKYLGEVGNLVLDEKSEVDGMRAEMKRSSMVLGRAATSAGGKEEVVRTVLAPRVLYRFRCRHVSKEDVLAMQQPVLAMMRGGLGVTSSFSRELLVGARRHRMVGMECWWDRLMREKLGMLMSMLMCDEWVEVRQVLGVWMKRLEEASGMRGGLMEGEYEACEEYSKTWLSQVLEWMGEVGVRVERNGEEGEQRQGRMLVECVGKEWRHRVLVICRRAEVYWEEDVMTPPGAERN